MSKYVCRCVQIDECLLMATTVTFAGKCCWQSAGITAYFSYNNNNSDDDDVGHNKKRHSNIRDSNNNVVVVVAVGSA